MWPDSALARAAVRSALVALDAVPLGAFVWLAVAFWSSPAPPAVVATVSLAPADAADLLLRYRTPLNAVTAWAALELAWAVLSRLWTALVLDCHRRRRDAASSPAGWPRISAEERWRIWKSMVESTADPAQWLTTAFLPKTYRHAPRGADDPAFAKIKLEALGRTNIEE
ncbi:hypothetical protein JCM3774_004574, partial [Rhodotorula dairenensis]